MQELYFQIGPLLYEVHSESDMICLPEFRQFTVPPDQISDASPEPIRCKVYLTDVLSDITGEPAFQNPERRIYKNGEYEIREFSLIGGPVYGRTFQTGPRELTLEILRSYVPKIEISYWFFEMLSLEYFLLDYDALILHSSFINYGNNGIVFSAPSGTGKSTQAGLWMKYAGADQINGDRSIIRHDRSTDSVLVCGLPFCGSSGYNKNEQYPLKAIVLLSQAKENFACRPSPFLSASRIFGECSINSWNTDYVDRALAVIERIIERVDVVSLACNMEEDAVTTLKNFIF